MSFYQIISGFQDKAVSNLSYKIMFSLDMKSLKPGSHGVIIIIVIITKSLTMIMTMTLKSVCEPGLVVIKIMIMTLCEPSLKVINEITNDDRIMT